MDTQSILSMVKSMEACSSLADIQDSYVISMRGRCFVDSSSLCGKIVRCIHNRKWTGVDAPGMMNAALQKIAQIMSDFFLFLSSLDSHPTELTKYLCRLSFFPLWQKRILHICALFAIKFPPRAFDIAERISAPWIVQDMTGVEVPWDVLEGILRKKPLNASGRTTLCVWMREVQHVGVAISPKVLFRVFEEASFHVFPGASYIEHEQNAFFLAVELYVLGFKGLLSADIFSAEEIKEDIGSLYHLKIGEELLFAFPYDLQLSCYTLTENSSRMLLISTAPLALGIWFHRLSQTKNIFPYLKVHACNSQFQFVVVDKLLGSFQSSVWEASGIQTKNDKTLADSFVNIVKTIISLQWTPKLDVGHFFVSSERNIFVLRKTEEQFPYPSITYIENFIIQACQRDPERISYVLQQASVHEQSCVRIFTEVLKWASTEDLIVAPQEMVRVCDVNKVFDPNLISYMIGWNKEVAYHARKVCSVMKQQVPISVLVETIEVLQKKLGFVTQIPSDLHQHMRKLIESRPQKQKRFFEFW